MEIQKQYNKVLDSLFTSDAQVDEVILTEGDKIAYLSKGKWKKIDIEFKILDADLIEYQMLVLQKKFGDTEGLYQEYIEDFQRKGHMNYSYSLPNVALRVNCSIGQGKIFVRLRKLPDSIPTPEELGIPPVMYDIVKDYKGGGLVIVSAKPGSGKSTTIASIIQKVIDEDILNIVTLEDPIEYIYKTSQSIVQQREKIFDFEDFKNGVESCMRQTPDIVVIQEITDPCILRKSLELAERGILVIATLHASDTSSIFEKILGSYDHARREEILNKLSILFRCFVSQCLIPKQDKSGNIGVFEVLCNTSEVRGYLHEENIQGLHQVMVRKPHLLMSDDIKERIECGDITRDDAKLSCPTSRTRFIF